MRNHIREGCLWDLALGLVDRTSLPRQGREHLASCTRCTDALREIKQLVGVLRSKQAGLLKVDGFGCHVGSRLSAKKASQSQRRRKP